MGVARRAVLALLLVVAASPALAQSFVDVTVSAGVDYTQLQVPPPFNDPYHQQDITGGAAAGDVDGDGWPDLVVTRQDAPPILFINDQDGTFSDGTVAAGLDTPQPVGSNGAVFADIDNDGDLDLYITSFDLPRHYLYINDGSGAFTEEAVARGAALDTANLNYGQGAAFGDYDLDGYLDLYVTEWRWDDGVNNAAGLPSHNRLLRNVGASNPGHFVDVTDAAGVNMDGVLGDREPGTHGFSPRFSDVDRDGRPDLLIAADFSCSRLYWNEGGGAFSDGTVSAGVGIDENGMGATVADFDGDGWLDWFVTSIARWNGGINYIGNTMYYYAGNRQFDEVSGPSGTRNGFWGWGTSALDYDNDGDEDLVMTNGVYFSPPPDPTRFWQNDGTGTFTEISAAVGIVDTGDGKGLLTFDFDRDGDLDIFIVNHNAGPRLYRNDGGNLNEWLQIVANGTAGNAQGIGARLSAVPDPGGAPLVKEISAGSNYLAADESIAHFGLGADASVSLLTIEWPGGVTQALVDVAAGQRLTVTEPATDAIELSVRRSGADVVTEWTTSGGPWSTQLVFRGTHPRFDASNLLTGVGPTTQTHTDAGAVGGPSYYYVVVPAN